MHVFKRDPFEFILVAKIGFKKYVIWLFLWSQKNGEGTDAKD